jgi:energy-coupling factor transport system substrate-specific component
MSTQEVQKEKRGLRAWTTRDLLVTAVIGIVFGLVAIPIQMVFTSLEMLTGPIGSRILIGIFYTPALMALYIIRRPGAAVLTRLIIALASVAFTPWGWSNILLFVHHRSQIRI